MARTQIPREVFEDESLRITGRELVRRHRAQPVLVKSLLLANEVETRLEKSTSTFPMNFILDLCKFQQKMHWLLPWGTLVFDETNRAPSYDLPQEISDMAHQPTSRFYRETFDSLVRNKHHEWDRIWAHNALNFEFLANVQQHPCEELYLTYSVGIELSDIEHLANCQSLRSLTLESKYHLDGITTALRKIQSVKHLDVQTPWMESFDLTDQIALYQRLPNMTSLHINRLDGPYNVNDLVKYIRKRKETLQHVKFEWCMEHSVAEALAECKNITSLQINDKRASYDVLEPLVTCKHLHQTVKHLDFSTLDLKNFSFLKFFSALRWLTLSFTDITNRDLREVILRNKGQLVEITVSHCEKITFRTLETITHCSGLNKIDLNWSRVKMKDYEAYKQNKRPNYEAIDMRYSAHRLES